MLKVAPVGRFFCLTVWLCLLAAMASCTSSADTPKTSPTTDVAIGDEPLYFESPQQAVTAATPMLREKNWPTLARYHDLHDTSIDRETLVDGRFFYQDKLEGFRHPAGFDHYKHPFAPGFKFMRTDPTNRDDVVVVTVQVEIDQGGGLVQRGLSSFYMRKSKAGWQFLPAKVSPFQPTSE